MMCVCCILIKITYLLTYLLMTAPQWVCVMSLNHSAMSAAQCLLLTAPYIHLSLSRSTSADICTVPVTTYFERVIRRGSDDNRLRRKTFHASNNVLWASYRARKWRQLAETEDISCQSLTSYELRGFHFAVSASLNPTMQCVLPRCRYIPLAHRLHSADNVTLL